jgi:hypothetical protein
LPGLPQVEDYGQENQNEKNYSNDFRAVSQVVTNNEKSRGQSQGKIPVF